MVYYLLLCSLQTMPPRLHEAPPRNSMQGRRTVLHRVDGARRAEALFGTLNGNGLAAPRAALSKARGRATPDPTACDYAARRLRQY